MTSGKQEATFKTKSVDKLIRENYIFKIPAFQRGYRWTAREVTDLLEDLNEFCTKRNDSENEEWYCLQPLVISKINDKYMVIDGQQRLTTLLLIFKYLEARNDLKDEGFIISYKTHEESEKFLDKIDKNYRSELKPKNIDFEYLLEAYKTIDQWFENNGGKVVHKKFKKLLLESVQPKVKFLWYETDVDPKDVFTRLNMGKISLTSAELIKALLLKKDSFEKEKETQRSLRAFEWEEFCKKLDDDDFWYFLQGENSEYSRDNRLEFVFDLWAYNKFKDDSQDNGFMEKLVNKDQYQYETFRKFNDKFLELEDNPVEHIWENDGSQESIKYIFRALWEWYKDFDLYHMIGFLLNFSYRKSEISGKTYSDLELSRELFADYKDCSYQEFKKKLREKIFKNVFSQQKSRWEEIKNNSEAIESFVADELDEITYEQSKKVKKILLLFNIAWLLRLREKQFEFASFKEMKFEIEHIRPVKEELPYNSVKDQKEWLGEQKKTLEKLEDSELLKKIDSFINESRNKSNGFENLAESIINACSESKTNQDDINFIDDIANLTLLPAGVNKSVSNSVFDRKRQLVKEEDKQGDFIPTCTKNVFLKYFSNNPSSFILWGPRDREDYFNEMRETISEFFSGGIKEDE